MKAPSRRGLLGSVAALVPLAAAGAVVAPAAARPTHPDAELIALCAEFDAAVASRSAVFDGPGAITDDEEAHLACAPYERRMDELLDAMARLRATTAAGIAARARTLAGYNGDFGYSFDHSQDPAYRMLDYLMRDAAALPAEVTT